MRKIKPEVRKKAVAVMLATVVLAGASTTSRAVEKRQTREELNLVATNIDGDTIKVGLENIKEVPKGIQFSIKLDESVELKEGEGSIRSIVEGSNGGEVNFDYTYDKETNVIEVLITAKESLRMKGTRIEVMELDVVSKSGGAISYEVLPIKEDSYKYVNINNKEYEGFEVTEPTNALNYIEESISQPPANPEEGVVEEVPPSDIPLEEETPEVETPPEEGVGDVENSKPEEGAGDVENSKPEEGVGGVENSKPEEGTGNVENGNPEEGAGKPESKPIEEGVTDAKKEEFKDIKGHWAKEDIMYLYNKGYIGGYGNNEFKPNQEITRAEFVKIVNKIKGYKEKGTECFKDVEENAWYYEDIKIAMKEGYIKGYEDGTFRPNAPITREEASKIIGEVLGVKGDGVLGFKDSKEVSAWAKEYVDGLEEEKLIGGYEDGTFRPKNKITRAEAVKVLRGLEF